MQNLIPGIEGIFNTDLSDKRVLVSLSGGINSAACLAYLCSEYKQNHKPKEIWLFYSHLREHSPGTAKFVISQIRYAQKHFAKVTWKIHRASVINFFKKLEFIPHPIISPCSDKLKRLPAERFIAEHKIDVDLIGFVKGEKRRIQRQQIKTDKKLYPISHYTDKECFEIVKREIGWYPVIYDIKENGKQVFKHNNCLPCKNFDGYLSSSGESSGDYSAVKKYYPSQFKRAKSLASEVNAYWGREPDLVDGHCSFCEFD